MVASVQAPLAELSPTFLQYKEESPIRQVRSVRITNVSDERVAFRVRTTAGKRYAVSPNKGFLAREESRVITFEYHPVLKSKASSELDLTPGKVNDHQILCSLTFNSSCNCKSTSYVDFAIANYKC